MPVQTTYSATMNAAFEGQRATLELTNVMSKVAEGGDIPFGRAVVRGTGDDQAKLPTATGQLFVGITEMTTAWAENGSGLHLYEQYREMNIIDFGSVWVYTEQAVQPGDPVYFRHTAAAAPLDVVGRFRKDASGGDADLIQGATFETTTAAGGIAQIKLNAPGTGLLISSASYETITALGASAMSIDTAISWIDSTLGVQAVTLADGVVGQRKTIKMLVDGGNSVVTPANFLDGTTITFDDAGDSCELLFDGTNWGVIGTPTATVA